MEGRLAAEAASGLVGFFFGACLLVGMLDLLREMLVDAPRHPAGYRRKARPTGLLVRSPRNLYRDLAQQASASSLRHALLPASPGSGIRVRGACGRNQNLYVPPQCTVVTSCFSGRILCEPRRPLEWNRQSTAEGAEERRDFGCGQKAAPSPRRLMVHSTAEVAEVRSDSCQRSKKSRLRIAERVPERMETHREL
jgi:hypothetical protein